MTILAIETATAVCGAALVREGRAISEAQVESPHVHSEQLISLIDRLLRAAALTAGQLDGVAVSAGPGSFTGLRIGVSVAKGLAWACGMPLAAVPTLESLASRALRQSIAPSGSILLPMIDARRAEVYTAVYRNEGGELEPIVPSRAALLHELVSLLPDGAPVVVMGDGADKFRSYLAEKDPESVARFCVPARELRLCSAADVGLLGERELAAGHSADVALLEPLYVKDARSLLRPHRVGAAS